MLTRHVQRAGLFFGAILAALLFFMGGAALRLLMGPVSLGPFAGIIEDALNHSVSGVVIRFDQAVLEWSRAEGKVNLIVLGTKVLDLNGHIIAQAPKADLDFDAAAIVAGHLSLKRFALLGVQLTGMRSKEGAIRLGFGPGQGEPDLLKTIRNILQNSAKGGGSLDSFSVRNARLAFRDEPTGLFIVSPDTNFTVQNRGDELDATLDSAVEISGAPARIAATAVLHADGMPDHGKVEIKGLSFPALARNSANLAALRPYQLISDLTLSFSLNGDGALAASEFQVTGAGSIEAPVLKSPLRLDKFAAQGSYDGPGNRLALESFSFDADRAAAKGNAAVTLGWNEGALETVSGNLEADDVRLNLPAWFPDPVALSHFSLQALYDRKSRTVTWERAVLSGGALAADLRGTASFAGAGSPALAVTGTMNALSIADALKYWPHGVGDAARDWIAGNVPEGRIGPIRVNADLSAGALDQSALPADALTLTFPFEGVTARYIATMTPVTGAHGQAKLTGDSFHLTVAAASVGPLAVTDGDVDIPDLYTHGVLSRITAHSESRMSDVLRLIDEEPLGYAKRFGINPASVEGHGAVDIDFQLPLLKDLPLDQIRIGVKAKATDLALPIDNRKFQHGMVSFVIDSKSLLSQGTATLSGVPVTFKWSEDFEAPGVTTRVDLAGRLDDANRAPLGLSEPKWLTGPMPVTLALTGRRFHLTDAAVKADLTNAVAEIPTLNLAKKTGVPANATAQLRFAEGGAMAINDLVVTGQGLNVRGGLSLDGEGRIINVSLADVRSGRNDFAMNIAPIEGGGLAFGIRGKSLDATHFLGPDTKKTPNAPPPAEVDSDLQNPLSIDAKLDRLVLRDNVNFRDVTLAVSFAAHEKLTGFNLDAIGIGKGKVTGGMSLVKGLRNLSLDSDDAGAFIDAFMSFSSVRGGKLAARISFPSDAANAASAKAPPPDYQGTITLSDVVITDQPFFARLFSVGSLDGPLRLLQGEGIALTSVNVPFSARGKMVTIREGRAAGAAIGATFSGTLDRKTNRVDLSGSLVPVYGLNSMLGALPVLGDILISKKGEGIFGLTYAMKGNLDEPGLTVNPLSVLTPGIFRRIFEFDTPKEPAPQPQPQAEPQPQLQPQPQASAEAGSKTAPQAPE